MILKKMILETTRVFFYKNIYIFNLNERADIRIEIDTFELN